MVWWLALISNKGILGIMVNLTFCDVDVAHFKIVSVLSPGSHAQFVKMSRFANCGSPELYSCLQGG